MDQNLTAPPAASAPRDTAAPASKDVPALLIGWILVALTDAVVLTFRLPFRAAIKSRLLVHLYDGGHVLAMGLVAVGLSAAFHRFAPRSRLLASASLGALGFALGYPLLSEDFSGAADRLSHLIHAETLWLVLLVLGAALLVPGAVFVGSLLARPRIRLLGVAGGVTLAAVNGANFPQNYPGLHLLGAVIAALLAGTSLCGGAVAGVVARAARRTKATLLAAVAIPAVLTIVVRPPNAAVLLLTQNPSAVLMPFLGQIQMAGGSVARIPPEQRAWFTDRSKLAPIAPSGPSLGQDAIVIMLGIDSMRADLLQDEKYRSALPELFRLRDESVYFAEARSAGSSTGPSLAALFASVYYSQLYWVRGIRSDRLVYPNEDHSPRFPELLSAAGVTTVTFDAAGWLLNDYGVVRGFTEEESLRRGGYPPASRLLNRALPRLSEQRSGRMFLFAHFLDAHAPYNSAGRKKTPFEGYLAELGLVDGQLRRLRQHLAHAKLLDRTTIVVFADHGEAFGEHGLTWHAATVYDELLRVPLLIRAPGVEPRVVRDRVSLIDVGPTLLDLMGVPTPGRYMGQSLAGYLRGETPKLSRPIVAEARLKRAMVMPDGFKVIHDARSQSVEIYDLNRDPHEEHNLYDDDAPSSAERLDTLLTFFQVHTLRRPGYKVPYRKW